MRGDGQPQTPTGAVVGSYALALGFVGFICVAGWARGASLGRWPVVLLISVVVAVIAGGLLAWTNKVIERHVSPPGIYRTAEAVVASVTILAAMAGILALVVVGWRIASALAVGTEP